MQEAGCRESSHFRLSRPGGSAFPFFLMITGYLLLDRSWDADQTRRFWKKNLFHLYICTVLWFAVYDFFLVLVMKKSISFTGFLQDILFLRKVGLSHVWYLTTILSFYVLIPFAANALRHYQVKYVYFPMAFYIVLSFLLPTLRTLNNILHFTDTFSIQLHNGFSGGAYGCYLLLGYMSRKECFKRIRTRVLGAAAVLFFCLTVGFQLFAYSHQYRYNVFYENLFLLLTSAAVFEMISRVKNVLFYEPVRKIAVVSFGIYLIHNLYISAADMYLLQNPHLHLPKPLLAGALWLAAVPASYISAVVIEKIPKIGKYILYIRE